MARPVEMSTWWCIDKCMYVIKLIINAISQTLKVTISSVNV